MKHGIMRAGFLTRPHRRSGFTLVEFVLFLGITAGMAGATIAVLLSTQDARIRQRAVADVEQAGVQTLLTITRTARRGEAIVDPPAGETGSVLAIQMDSSLVFPTIFGASASGQLFIIQAASVRPLAGDVTVIKNLKFANLSSGDAKSLRIDFDMEKVVPLPQQKIYAKHFSAGVTLYPDDDSEAGGCGSCPLPTCTNGTYTWNYCLYEVCTTASQAMKCN